MFTNNKTTRELLKRYGFTRQASVETQLHRISAELRGAVDAWNEQMPSHEVVSDQDLRAFNDALRDNAIDKYRADKDITVLKIPQKMSGTGTIHDIASTYYDREIEFGPEDQYAIVLAAHYGDRYKVFDNIEDLLESAQDTYKSYSYKILDRDGKEFEIQGDKLKPAST